MGKTAFMFPGQGAQITGMGKHVYEKYEVSRNIFITASEISGFDMEELIFTENDRLDKTRYTQLALYTAEIAVYEALKELDYSADAALGLSLGEYSAITVSGALSFNEGCSVVKKRGMYMEEAGKEHNGAMAAVIGAEEKTVEEVIARCREDNNEVCIANYNCPGQIVISGDKTGILKACEALKQAGAKRTVELNVSGAFHSPLLVSAGERLSSELEKVTFNEICIPYVANLTADYVYDCNKIKKSLIKQVYSPVKFEQSVRRLINDGYDDFIEIGPGKTLAGFVKKIAKNMGAENINVRSISGEEL